jgi:hypothetical protein
VTVVEDGRADDADTSATTGWEAEEDTAARQQEGTVVGAGAGIGGSGGLSGIMSRSLGAGADALVDLSASRGGGGMSAEDKMSMAAAAAEARAMQDPKLARLKRLAAKHDALKEVLDGAMAQQRATLMEIRQSMDTTGQAGAVERRALLEEAAAREPEIAQLQQQVAAAARTLMVAAGAAVPSTGARIGAAGTVGARPKLEGLVASPQAGAREVEAPVEDLTGPDPGPAVEPHDLTA